MDELTLLREMRSEVAEPTAEQLAPGLERLERRMTKVRPRPAVRRLRVVGVMAAVAVATVVVGQTTVSVQRADAATVLNNAADETIKTVDPVVGPGQFLLVHTVSHYSVIDSSDQGDYRWMRPQIEDVYRPADPNADWTLVRTYGKPDSFADAPSKKRALSQPSDGAQPELLRAKNGAFYGDPWQSYDLSTLPREPQALYDRLDADYNGGSASRAENDWERMVQILRSGSVPADLRAALYKALALIPGVTVGDRKATLDGRTGIAIGRTEWLRGGDRNEVIIDPDTGMLIGEREVMLLPLFGFRAGEVVGSTSVTTSVVDSAP